MSQKSFQVDLSGIINLLSHHLYSGPEVFVREVLQNAVDAISMRQLEQPTLEGQIELQVGGSELRVRDNGVGLTEAEIHSFLSTIGSSAKRDAEGNSDFIGRFGIGLLACFLVSDEIVMHTRSARGGPSLVWRGKSDGSYGIEASEQEFAAGTEVVLTLKPDYAYLADPDELKHLTRFYGDFLPQAIYFLGEGGEREQLNAQMPPWQRLYPDDAARDAAIRAYGAEVLGSPPFDWFGLRSPAGEIEGVVFVVPWKTESTARGAARVYLKNMLLSSREQDFLPKWGFFAQAVFNANALQPTASRESLQHGPDLEAAKAEVAQQVKNYILEMAEQDRPKLGRFIELHYSGLKALAMEDDEFYRIVMLYMPFQTAAGFMALEDYLAQHPKVRYVDSLDQFRQIAQVALASGQNVVNAAYVHEADLLAKLPGVFPQFAAERLEASDLARDLEQPAPEVMAKSRALVEAAHKVLDAFDCVLELRSFEPAALPALFVVDSKARNQRFFQKSRDVADDLWGNVLDELQESQRSASSCVLYLNTQNPTIGHLLDLPDTRVLERLVLTLYLQSLLLGQHPMSAREYELLNESLTEMLVWGIRSAGQKSLN